MAKRKKPPNTVIRFPRPNIRDLRVKYGASAPRPIQPPRIDWRTPPGNPEPRE